MNTSLTEILSSLLFLVAQSTLPAVMPTQQVQLGLPSTAVQAAPARTETETKTRPARKRVNYTPYYDFGRRNTRAKD